MRTNGRGADPMGPRVMEFGAPCPICMREDVYAVHEAVVPLIDEGGDIVLPHLYALCCDCDRVQSLQKYGQPWQGCGCGEVDLQALARSQQLLEPAVPISATDARVTIA